MRRSRKILRGKTQGIAKNRCHENRHCGGLCEYIPQCGGDAKLRESRPDRRDCDMSGCREVVEMATLGTPFKDGDKWYQRWYPGTGDIRPEGLEICDGEEWGPVRTSPGMPQADDCESFEYRIPSTYVPPAGWYCVGDGETVPDGRYAAERRRNLISGVRNEADRGGWWRFMEPSITWTS